MNARKYEGDGNLERIDPARLVVGCVVRMPHGDGSVHAFGDSVVTGISVRSWKFPGNGPVFYANLAEALAAKTEENYVYIHLARPYAYASTPPGGRPNWLVGMEILEADAGRALDLYRVVVQSSGAYATQNL